MDIHQIRRSKLEQYIKNNFKSRKAFLDFINRSYPQVASQFLRTGMGRNIGEKLAREIEVSLGVPAGYLDSSEGLELDTGILVSNKSGEGEGGLIKDLRIAGYKIYSEASGSSSEVESSFIINKNGNFYSLKVTPLMAKPQEDN